MPRPPREVPRAEVRPDELEFYDAVKARASTPGRQFAESEGENAERFRTAGEKGYDYYTLMLHSPEMSFHLSEMGRLVRAVGLKPGSYSHWDREFVDQVLCPLLGTNLVLPGHIADAVAAGVRIEAIEALQNGRDEDLTEDELLLATFVRHVTQLQMSDETWARMEARIGERGTVELMIFTGLLNMILRMQSALGMPEAPDEQIRELISGIKAGRVEVGAFVDRSGAIE